MVPYAPAEYVFYESSETIKEHFLEMRRGVAISDIPNGLD
jgi:hypothetical protein